MASNDGKRKDVFCRKSLENVEVKIVHPETGHELKANEVERFM